LAGFFDLGSGCVSLLFLLGSEIFLNFVFKLTFWFQQVFTQKFAEVDLLNKLACAGEGFDVLPWHFNVDNID